MKKNVLFFTVLALALSASVFADMRIGTHETSDAPYLGANGLGFGIVFGEIDGISIKNWVSHDNAFQYDINWDLYYTGLGIGVAYLFHNFEMIQADNNKFPLYIGIKAWAAMATAKTAIGVQVPLGIAWIPKNTPIDVFLQIEPGLSLIPNIHIAPGGGIGLRYWLN